MPRIIPDSELIINPDGSVFHLHLLPEQLTDRIILVGDPARVDMVASFFDSRTFEVSAREFHTIGGTYKGKPIMCISHGIGPDNIDIVITELDALANVDFKTREVKENKRVLTMVRIGTSGALHACHRREINRFRRRSELLCRPQRSGRSRFRACFLRAYRMESPLGKAIRRRCRPRTR